MIFKRNNSDPEDVELEVVEEVEKDATPKPQNNRDYERRLDEGLRLLKTIDRQVLRNLKRRHSAVMKLQDKLMVRMQEERQGFLVTPKTLAELAQFQMLQNSLSIVKRDHAGETGELEKTLEEITLQSDNSAIDKHNIRFQGKIVRIHKYYLTHQTAFYEKLVEYSRRLRQPLPLGARPETETGG